MGDSAIELETRAAMQAQIEQAAQLRDNKPGVLTLWPIGLYLCIAVAVMAGLSVNTTLESEHQRADHRTTAALRKQIITGHGTIVRHQPLGGSAGIAHSSPTLNHEEARQRICVTAEFCHDVAWPTTELAPDVIARLPTTVWGAP